MLPSEPLHFTPLRDFYSDETRSHYVAGLGYTATNEQLQRLVEIWIEEGLVQLGRINGQITGHGIVT